MKRRASTQVDLGLPDDDVLALRRCKARRQLASHTLDDMCQTKEFRKAAQGSGFVPYAIHGGTDVYSTGYVPKLKQFPVYRPNGSITGGAIPRAVVDAMEGEYLSELTKRREELEANGVPLSDADQQPRPFELPTGMNGVGEEIVDGTNAKPFPDEEPAETVSRSSGIIKLLSGTPLLDDAMLQQLFQMVFDPKILNSPASVFKQARTLVLQHRNDLQVGSKLRSQAEALAHFLTLLMHLKETVRDTNAQRTAFDSLKAAVQKELAQIPDDAPAGAVAQAMERAAETADAGIDQDSKEDEFYRPLRQTGDGETQTNASDDGTQTNEPPRGRDAGVQYDRNIPASDTVNTEPQTEDRQVPVSDNRMNRLAQLHEEIMRLLRAQSGDTKKNNEQVMRTQIHPAYIAAIRSADSTDPEEINRVIKMFEAFQTTLMQENGRTGRPATGREIFSPTGSADSSASTVAESPVKRSGRPATGREIFSPTGSADSSASTVAENLDEYGRPYNTVHVPPGLATNENNSPRNLSKARTRLQGNLAKISHMVQRRNNPGTPDHIPANRRAAILQTAQQMYSLADQQDVMSMQLTADQLEGYARDIADTSQSPATRTLAFSPA